MIGLVVAGALVGMVVMRQVQSQKVVPAPDPSTSPRAAESVGPPPVAVKPPEAQPAAPPPVAASPEPPPPPPAEVAPPEEMVVAINEHAAGKHNAAGKNHKHLALKAGAVASASSPPPPAAAEPAPVVAPVKAETPPKLETPPVRVAPPAPAVAANQAPAPKPPAAALSSPPPATAPAALQPGFVDPKAVNLIVRSHADEANACYERATMEHPDLHGRVIIHAVIDPSGRVASVSPTSSITDGARLQSCLVRGFKSWVFPRPVGGVNGNVTYSFSFESP